jgi:hypothetical protein
VTRAAVRAVKMISFNCSVLLIRLPVHIFIWLAARMTFFWKPIVHWQSNCHPEVLITSITKLLVDILGHIGIAPYCFSLSASKISFASEAQAEESFGCACRVSTPDYFSAKPGRLTLSAWRNPAA